MSFDNKTMLARAITLLYLEGQIPNNQPSTELVTKIIEEIKLPDSSLSISHEREVLESLRETAGYLCTEAGSVIDKAELLQRLKLNCSGDEQVYVALKQGIDVPGDIDAIKRSVLGIRNGINTAFREHKLFTKFKEAYTKLSFERHKIKKMADFYKEFIAETEPYAADTTRVDPAIVASVDFSDENSLTAVCEAVQETVNGSTGFTLGWQDLNDMVQGRLLRGETVGIQALQHNYKTGFSLTVFRQLASYNLPVNIDPTKKPLLLRISFEDSLPSNIQFLFQNIYQNANNGEMPELTKYSAKEMAVYVQQEMGKNGWHIRMLRVNPSEWTYQDIQGAVIAYEAQGYEVHCLMVDYLPMIPTKLCEQGPAGHDYRDLLRRMRNFCSARNILFITPWQMSTDAKMLLREGRTEFLKNIMGRGYYSGSKQVDQEFDLEIGLHIEVHNGCSFLTVGRGKHRRPTTVAEQYKFFVLPFPEVGSILDDVNRPRIGRRRLGGGIIGTGQETPLTQFDDF